MVHEEGDVTKQWLKNIRKAKDMTQKMVAEQAEISRTYYTRIECGIRGNNLPVPTAKAIADVLHFDWRRFYEEDQAS